MIQTTSPKSGWLNKLTTNNTFGASRWQARYFVLLDSELRYYKDEHTATASRTINLRDISKVIITESVNRHYCFKLEPTLYYQNKHLATIKTHKKIWTMQCKTEYELQSWIAAINLRLSKLCFDEEDTISTSVRSLSVSEQKQQSMCSKTSDSSRPLKHPAPSISRRRGVILSPLDVCTLPCLESSDMLSSSSSKGSDLPSPIRSAANEDDDDMDETMNKRADKLTTHNAYVLNTSSPTFALYKERFHL
ncbi:hypothetical protein INT47_006073 [Mucor saturninus]|uniref:PH domain-containing protein n=1 Tax=Mucor saturninus TaxID=64648 RepID=A0A8H7RCN2_9FUNG|nr:hypothetical protein INT47_006073 [Mucor saturninus]